MFLAHFSNTSIQTINSWTVRKIKYWYDNAVSVHNQLNTPVKE